MMRSSTSIARSPVTLEDFELMKKTALFDEDDVRYLRRSREVLADQTDAILDVWYGFVGSQPHLLHYFTNPADGQPIGRYLDAVRVRFGQWILDTAEANYDQDWLDYQYTIGLRHHRVGKNRTDDVDSVDHIHFRYLIPLLVPITVTLKPFLAKKGDSPEDVDRMHAAWLKSVVLQLTLWSQPYCREGDF
ncbi:MAG TPA: protoglobin domain-containing protein [Longimicrobiales bacterium]|nr:protoglobin domain-containing protein [Longimicrobiales bacterium]